MTVPEDVISEECLRFINRTRTCTDNLAPQPVHHYAALFDRAPDALVGDAVPPLMHWLYFHEPVAQSDLGEDGHERLGLFLPPVPYHRRMWAAGEVRFQAPLRFGRPATRQSTIANVTFKSGRSGPLCFVDVDHVVEQQGTVCIQERQTIVYRNRGLPMKHSSSDRHIQGGRTCEATMLFRYSALTSNMHKIHLDRDFCRDVEGYPALVVHGPLLATLLCERAAEKSTLAEFSFRAEAPVFEGDIFRTDDDGDRNYRIVRADGQVAMRGAAQWHSEARP